MRFIKDLRSRQIASNVEPPETSCRSHCFCSFVKCTCSVANSGASGRTSAENRSGAQGLEQAELRLKFLERNDAPIVERFEVASKLVDEFTGRDEPRILGLALLAKGTTQGQLGDLKKGVEILGEAERPAKLVADEFPEIFFKARSNRALYLVALGNKTEPVGLLHEVIEYAKPYGDQAQRRTCVSDAGDAGRELGCNATGR